MARVASPRQIAEAQARKSGFRGENLGRKNQDIDGDEPEHEGGEDAEHELDSGDHDRGQGGVEAGSSLLLEDDQQNCKLKYLSFHWCSLLR